MQEAWLLPVGVSEVAAFSRYPAWHWTIKALRHAKSVFLATSGSVTDEGIVDMAAEILGVDRLPFGCDMSMTAGVGKIDEAFSAVIARAD